MTSPAPISRTDLYCTSLEALIPCTGPYLEKSATESGNFGFLGQVKAIEIARNAVYFSSALAIIGAIGTAIGNQREEKAVEYSFMAVLIAGSLSTMICFKILSDKVKDLIILSNYLRSQSQTPIVLAPPAETLSHFYLKRQSEIDLPTPLPEEAPPVSAPTSPTTAEMVV